MDPKHNNNRKTPTLSAHDPVWREQTLLTPYPNPLLPEEGEEDLAILWKSRPKQDLYRAKELAVTRRSSRNQRRR
jgi:hypothetical protein